MIGSFPKKRKDFRECSKYKQVNHFKFYNFKNDY